MAVHLLDELKRSTPAIYDRVTYTIIETSAFHRGLQRTALKEHEGLLRFTSEQEWMDEEPQAHMFIIANELLDAFPVHRIRYMNGVFQESYVTWQEHDRIFSEIWLPIKSKPLLDTVDRIKVQWREGQIGELNIASETWIARVSKRMASGSCLVIDYGDVEEEVFAAHRQLGTLMCYRKHQAHENPWIYQGNRI